MMSAAALADWIKVSREIGERHGGENDAIAAIFALDDQNRKQRDLLWRLVRAGVNWEFGSNLRDDVEALIGRWREGDET